LDKFQFGCLLKKKVSEDPPTHGYLDLFQWGGCACFGTRGDGAEVVNFCPLLFSCSPSYPKLSDNSGVRWRKIERFYSKRCFL